MSNIEIIEIRIPGPMPPIVDNPDLSVEPTKLALRGNVEANFVARTPKRRFKTIPLMLADTATTYAVVSEGDEFEAGVFSYQVAASDASDHHVETAGGVKLYVLPIDGAYHLEAFGSVAGDYLTDAPEDIVDSTIAFQKAIDVTPSGGSLVLPSGTVYVGNLTIPYGKINTTITGEGQYSPTSAIQFLDGATDGFRLEQEAYNFKNLIFRGIGNVEAAALFTSARDDGRADQDWAFFNCLFANTRHIGKLKGRGLTVDNCVLSSALYDDAFVLDFPAEEDFVPGPAGNLGSWEGGFRGFTVRNSRIHGLSKYLFRVNSNNAENARGFTITGNQCDSYAKIIKGYAKEVEFSANNWYMGWNDINACFFDLVSGHTINISGNVISNSNNGRQGGDNPLIRFISSFYGLIVANNTFVRRDVPVLSAELPSGAAVTGVTIANNTYYDCFIASPYLAKITGGSNGVRSVKIDEAIHSVPANWQAVYGDGYWLGCSVRVIMLTGDAVQHNLSGASSRGNDPRSGAYQGDGTSSRAVFVGYPPSRVRVYKNDGTLVAAKVANGISSQPTIIAFTTTGFTVNGAANTNAVVYYWEAG